MDDTGTKACQRDTINALRRLIVEHHSHDVMKGEHTLCPVCTKQGWDTVLNIAAKLGQAGDEQPASVETAEAQGVGISDLLGEARVEAVKGYLQNRLSLVGALEKKSSYYNSNEKDKDWLVEELKRIDNAVASLLASPNDPAERRETRDSQ